MKVKNNEEKLSINYEKNIYVQVENVLKTKTI